MIDKNLFIKSIQAIQKNNDYYNEINSINRKYQLDFTDYYPPQLETELITVLDSCFPDSDNLVDYWIYELKFGTEWKPNMVINSNGKDVKLQTIDDLWNALISDKKNNRENERFNILMAKYTEVTKELVAAKVLIKAAGLEERYKMIIEETERRMRESDGTKS